MRVVLRGDASPSIGTGHVARLLALGEALRASGHAVQLASVELPVQLSGRAEELGIGVAAIDAVPASDEDAEQLRGLLDADAHAVIDGYHLGPTYRRRVAAREPTVVDDLVSDVSDAGLVVNQNLYATLSDYLPQPVGELLLGPTYAMLRSEFADARRMLDQPALVRRVLVSMGGGDPGNATRLAIDALTGSAVARQVRVLVGGSHPEIASTTAGARSAGFEVVHDARDVAAHIAWADVVVGACGSSVLEVASVGRPLVGVILADNQERVASAVVELGLGVVAGRASELTPDGLRGVVNALGADPATRLAMAERGPRLVDGQGARRVAAAVTSGPIALRPVTPDDAALMYAWANEPATRAASFHPAPIGWDEHLRWLSERLADPGAVMVVGELGGTPIGLARFAVAGDSAQISVSVDARRRSGGLGTRLIGAACALVVRQRAVQRIDAFIRADNGASLRAFERAGFTRASRRTGDGAPADAVRMALHIGSVTMART